MIELHTSLWNENFMYRFDLSKWYEHILKNTRSANIKGIEFTALSFEDEFINQIVHFATHMAISSVKIKNLCDIVLFVKAHNNVIDWIYVSKTLEDMGLMKFSRCILAACNEYLGLIVPKEFFSRNESQLSKAIMENIFYLLEVSNTENYKENKDAMMFYFHFASKSRLHIWKYWLKNIVMNYKEKKGTLISMIRQENKAMALFNKRIKLLRTLTLLR